jgi:hypothetical protein
LAAFVELREIKKMLTIGLQALKQVFTRIDQFKGCLAFFHLAFQDRNQLSSDVPSAQQEELSTS